MKAVDFAKQVGYVAVRKVIAGNVLITTTPHMELTTGEVFVLARTHDTAEAVLRDTNVVALVDQRKLVLVF